MSSVRVDGGIHVASGGSGSLFGSETGVPELSGDAECKHSWVIFGGFLKLGFSEAPFYPRDAFS